MYHAIDPIDHDINDAYRANTRRLVIARRKKVAINTFVVGMMLAALTLLGVKMAHGFNPTLIPGESHTVVHQSGRN